MADNHKPSWLKKSFYHKSVLLSNFQFWWIQSNLILLNMSKMLKNLCSGVHLAIRPQNYMYNNLLENSMIIIVRGRFNAMCHNPHPILLDLIKNFLHNQIWFDLKWFINVFHIFTYTNANPWIWEVFGDGWGVPLYKDFA